MHYPKIFAISLLVLSIVCGCGSDPLGRKAISGTVNVDGAPVEQGNISFQPTGPATTSSGATITGGKFTIEREVGLPVGKYKVIINAPVPGTIGELPADAMPGDVTFSEPKELIPPEWNDKSDQVIEVKEEGPFEFKFDIVTKKN